MANGMGGKNRKVTCLGSKFFFFFKYLKILKKNKRKLKQMLLIDYIK